MFVFISENPSFVDFNDTNALIWEKNGLTYGDWNAGINGDGTFTSEVDFTPSDVSTVLTVLSTLGVEVFCNQISHRWSRTTAPFIFIRT